MPLDFPPVPESKTATNPEAVTPETEPVAELATEAEPATKAEPEVAAPEPNPLVVTGRPSRITRKPIRFGDYECYPCEANPKNEAEMVQNQKKVAHKDFREELATSRPYLSPPMDPEKTEKVHWGIQQV